MMPHISFFIVLFLGVLSFILYPFLKKGNTITPIQIMLFGIELTLFGGVLVIHTGALMGGLEYIFLFLGLIVTIMGFFAKQNS